MQPSSAMICCPSSRCRRVVSPNWHFCAHCGEDLRPHGLSRPKQEECDHHFEMVGSHCTLCGFDSQPMWGLEKWQRTSLGIACFPAGLTLMILPHLIRLGQTGGMMVIVGGLFIAIGAALLLNIKNSFRI